MNTHADTYRRLESPTRGQTSDLLTDAIPKASSDADGQRDRTDEAASSVISPQSIIRASLAPLALRPSTLTQHPKYSAQSPSDNAFDLERNEPLKPQVGNSHPSKTSNKASSLSQKSLMARFIEYLSSQDMKKSMQSAEQDQVVDGWLNMNQKKRDRRSKYKSRLLKVLNDRATQPRGREALAHEDGGPQGSSYLNIHYNSDDGRQKADAQWR